MSHHRAVAHRPTLTGAAVALSLLLAACGGSGGGGGSGGPDTRAIDGAGTDTDGGAPCEETAAATLDGLLDCLTGLQDDIDAGPPDANAGPGANAGPLADDSLVALVPGSGLYSESNTAFVHDNPPPRSFATADPATQRREIPFTVLQGSDAVRIDRLFSLARPGSEDIGIELVGIATNVSEVLQCRFISRAISLGKVTLTGDGAGQAPREVSSTGILEIDGYTAISGQNDLLAGDDYWNECIAPGASVYFRAEDVKLRGSGLNERLAFGSLASVEIERVQFREREAQLSADGALATRLDGQQVMTINTSNRAMDIDSIAVYSIDDTGFPFFVEVSDGPPRDLEPGESFPPNAIGGSIGTSLANAARLLVVVRYERDE